MVEILSSMKTFRKCKCVYIVASVFFVVGLVVLVLSSVEIARRRNDSTSAVQEAPPSFVPRTPIEPIIFVPEPSSGPSPHLSQRPSMAPSGAVKPVLAPSETTPLPTQQSTKETPTLAPSLRTPSPKTPTASLRPIGTPIAEPNMTEPTQMVIPSTQPALIPSTQPALNLSTQPALNLSTHPTMSPSTHPTMSPSAQRANQLWESLGEVSTLEEGTPSFQAARWIIDADPLQIDSDSDNLVQRFTLATVYFATGGSISEESSWEYCSALSEGVREGDGSCTFVDQRGVTKEAFRFLSSQRECQWIGIRCMNGQVVDVKLAKNNITGQLPDEIGLLTRLEKLHLAENSLGGRIPNTVENLPSLTSLLLNDNLLSGPIPDSLYDLSSLDTVNLGINQLTGQLSKQIKNLEGLKYLSVRHNKMSGKLPGKELGKLTKLTSLSFDYNEWNSNVPKEIGKLTNLRRLFMARSQLTGGLPREISNLENLEDFSFIGNNITGNLPDLSGLTNLASLRGEWNQLTGPLPQLPITVERVSLHRNKLEGALPDFLPNNKLTSLTLFYNDLTGSIPSAVCGQFETIEVDCLRLIECDCCDLCCDRELGCQDAN